MMNLECNICKSKQINDYFYVDKWNIVKCGDCGLVFVGNVPEDNELKSIYDDKFFLDGQKSPIEGGDITENPTYYNSIKRIEALKKQGYDSGRMLDIGCATGIFLKAATSTYDCYGLDVSDVAVNIAVNQIGVNAKCGTVFDLKEDEGTYDVITMWDVIEHVKDPTEYIKKTSNFLKKGGLLVVSTGNIDSLMFKIQKKKWHLMIPPFHLFYFNTNNIKKLLEKNGLEVLKIFHDGQSTNVGYITSKMYRMNPTNILIKYINKFVHFSRLSKLNIYLNLFDVMTVYSIKK